MSSGTAIIEKALQKLGAHSVASPASPEDMIVGMDALNSMLELWLSQDIVIGFTPLTVPGGQLNEPVDTTNAIVYNLAIHLSPDFDNGKNTVSPELKQLALNGLDMIKKLYQVLTIPNKKASSTLHTGSGHVDSSYVGVSREIGS